MRITHHSLVEQVIANVESRMRQIAESQGRVSTGRRVRKPSDDPAAAGEILSQQSRMNRIEQYKRNITSGLSHLGMTENALAEIRDITIRTRGLAVQGANDVTSAQGRQAIAEQVDGLLRELASIANRKSGNHYIFGGNETRVSPYQPIDGENGWLEQVVPRYQEQQSPVELIYGEGERAEVTLTADDTFDFGDGENLFAVLFDLRQALADDDGQAIGDVLPRLDEALDNLNGVTAMVGARINTANSMLDSLENQAVSVTDRISRLGDIDIAQAMTKLNEDMISYEMALRMSAKSIQPSLVNFVYL